MKYIKTKNGACYAIDETKKIVYVVLANATKKELQIRNEPWLPNAILLLDSDVITVGEFQKQFSDTVNYFHNETPFA